MGGAVKAVKKVFTVENALRTAAAIGTGGTSELTRDKPFQPGGKTSVLSTVTGGLGLANAAQAGSLTGAAQNASSLAGSSANPATQRPDALGQAVQATNALAITDKVTGENVENFIRPPLPPVPDNSNIENQVKAAEERAKNSVITADAEARRARAAKR